MKITIAIKTTIAVVLYIGTSLTGFAVDSELPFRVDHNAPLNGTESIVKDAVDHLHLRIEFNGIDGDRIPAFLYIPKDENKKHPTVFLQYGSGGSKTTDYIMQIGKQFIDNGFVVLTIDSAFRGERRHPDKKDPFV
ncbi:MAG: alpha/beta hydrolase family protein, partial [Pirellulales bacterium]